MLHAHDHGSYPRAETLGGCAAHNALVWITPHASDWNGIANITGDSSWAASNMDTYLNRVYSWLSTGGTDPSLLDADSMLMQHYLGGAATMGLGPTTAQGTPNTTVAAFNSLLKNPNGGANDPTRDAAQGFYQIQYSQQNGVRESIRDLIVATVAAGYPLTVRTNAFVTKVNFNTSGSTPRATGVSFLDGAHLYRASPLSGGTGTPGVARATREVIVAGGTFNTPQLLKLSGIGPKAELAANNITTLVNLPGVGKNMQDRYEVPVSVVHPNNFEIVNGCEYDGQPDDLCFQQWINNPNGPTAARGIYASNGLAAGMAVHSKAASTPDIDLYIFGGAVNFYGYYPGWPQVAAADHMHWTWYMLKAHSRNTAGTVTLRSADPLDVPAIQFNYFDTGTTAGGADQLDLATLVQGVKTARQALQLYGNYSSLNGTTFTEEKPGPTVQTDAQIEQWVKDFAWGHHACCTAPMGAASDPNAVLDSQMRVRGTTGLRVVDASVFPKIPGIFLQSPIYMMAEKAADAILAAAH
jgi:choline dehydrogenase